jgi:hypothetical protein
LADGRAGRLIEAAQSGEGFEALAVLSVDAGKPAGDSSTEEAGPAAAIIAAELPLPYPL